ncbi:S10 family peptidase [Dokdonella fugitiva]|jgi:carboxypeptidase C (cathepsin A)|uniref:Carboxypeptidase C (Cathepsin A) n=1 Tax=Dokdonella fugitiva TaxID=328517 RepID=A0A4R2I1G6_9GAMM|nr:peptidase S10 [Dokdonella fugitiva]TCO37319.1 carboxypeptidase C (cathepsin A) [Dokdonella fugitiva]
MKKPSLAALFTACLLFASPLALAADDGGKDAAKEAKGDDYAQLPPFPADRTVRQQTTIDGRSLAYDATVGSLPVLDEKGRTIAEVMFVAYTVPGKDRPVTFALNGGPGASSVYLNLGALGPKRVQFGAEGNSPSDPATPHDNQGSWLDFTDLVFIDPVGTGFSRARVPEDEAKKKFYSTGPDIEYLSRIIYDWLVKNDRLMSRKYLVGESYGGFRGPRITHFLQTRLGVAMNGLVLVSPYLDPSADDNGDLSPLPWMLTLPSIAAANLERHGRLTDQAMADVVAYTRGDYVTDLLKGRSDPQSVERIVKRVTELSGLDAEFVRRSGGRLETQAYLREVFRDEGKLGSRYDSNVTAWDPFPFAPAQRTNDPILDGIIAPTTTAMVDFITRTVGWKYTGRYNALSYEVNKAWERGEEMDKGSVQQLRQSVAIDSKLQVLIAHGWGDLSCPFMASVLIVDQMPVMGDPNRVRVAEYPGGHMFYSRGDSQAALRRDVMKLYAAH